MFVLTFVPYFHGCANAVQKGQEPNPALNMVCARSIGVAIGALTETDLLNDLTAKVWCSVGENEVEVRFLRSNPMLRGGGVYIIVSPSEGFKIVAKKGSK